MAKKIIVQAGGRGSRMRHHTWNKPKCLIPYQGQPMLYRLFDIFPDDEFHIIGDYLYEVVENYLKVNVPPVKFELLRSTGKGTSSGIEDALDKIDDASNIVIVWCDIVLPEDLPELCFNEPTIYTSDEFVCRWNLQEDGKIVEAAVSNEGIFGLFTFPNKSFIHDVASEEFVHHLSVSGIKFAHRKLSNVKEIGDFRKLERIYESDTFSRFFNEVRISGSKVIKKVVDSGYENVHSREIAWYKEAARLKFPHIPNVENYQPLTMEKIDGKHAYQMKNIPLLEKRLILDNYFSILESMHSLQSAQANEDDMRRVYIDKTSFRVFDVADMIPNFLSESITVNGIRVRNFFCDKHYHMLEDIFDDITVNSFVFIHGDPTFSNSLIGTDSKVTLIDPRGYFSDQSSSLLGDPNYDFAKLYYSAVGGYDLFNRKQFKLFIDEQTVEIIMQESEFKEEASRQFNERFSSEYLRSIRIIHGLIWLSLTGYSKDNVDSVIAAFYLGLLWLELGLEDAA